MPAPYLSPASPDLDPIKQVVTRLKHMLLEASERKMEETWRKIGALLNRLTP